MTEHFGQEFSEALIGRVLTGARFEERCADGARPLMSLVDAADGSGAGFLRLWAATDDGCFDRLIHFRLQSPPIDTHLIFLFGRADTAMPHFHAQVVQFAPDTCVYNADIIPRLDPVDHPGYFAEVYGPVTKAYFKAATDPKNACSMAPANPAIAAYLSPWSIAAGRPTTRDELERVIPSIHAYVDQCLALARGLSYHGPPADELRSRDRRHMEIFHSDELDPRAWKGVYRVLGEEAGHRVKEMFRTPVRQPGLARQPDSGVAR
jgi:hypothetical protein